MARHSHDHLVGKKAVLDVAFNASGVKGARADNANRLSLFSSMCFSNGFDVIVKSVYV